MFFIKIVYSCFFLIIYNQCNIISSLPKHWSIHSHSPHLNHRENFYFYLKQQNNDILNDHLLVASDPNHNLYHQTPWLTLDQISEIVRPDPISVNV
jgi:hypothetical protein